MSSIVLIGEFFLFRLVLFDEDTSSLMFLSVRRVIQDFLFWTDEDDCPVDGRRFFLHTGHVIEASGQLYLHFGQSTFYDTFNM